MKHRREIDGLRALAVLPVILFHAGFETFSGGFVGVDVFFVISGYLITRIITAEIEAGTFSVAAFYERRARRLLPALFFMLFVCLPVAWFSLLPADMERFCKSLVAVSTFGSNVLFWRESGYFDAAAELKPLLHTWSLAVEEQYYFVCPMIMLFLRKRGRNWLEAGLWIGLFASFAVAEWAIQSRPNAAFFLLPTRGWEMLVGALAATSVRETHPALSRKGAREIGGLLGIGLIVFSVLAYSEAVPFPGRYALLPTVGCALVLLCASEQTWVGRALGHRIPVSIGLVSYSAYLWHQPLFAFARLRGFSDSHVALFASLAVAAIALGYVSWRFVEAPFRDRSITTKRSVAVLATVGTAFFIAAGCVGVVRKGDLGQLSREQASFLDHFENSVPEWRYFEREGVHEKNRADCDFYDLRAYRAGRETKVPVPRLPESCSSVRSPLAKVVFLWGDSHAAQLRYGLEQLLPRDYELLQVTSSGCVARLNAQPSSVDYCEQSNWFAFDAIRKVRPRVVVIAGRDGHSLQEMSALTSTLKALGVQRIVFPGPTPKWFPALPSVLVHMLPDIPERTFVGLDEGVIALDRERSLQAKQQSAFEYVSLVDYLCTSAGCSTHLGDGIPSGIVSYDYGHLTPFASFQVAKERLAPVVFHE